METKIIITLILTALCCGAGGATIGALVVAILASSHSHELYQQPEFGDIFRKGIGK